MRIIVFVFLLIANLATAQIKVGDTLPSITLKNSDNKDVNITSFKGKYVLIDFWASWCAPCRLGNKKLVKLHNDISQDKIEIIGISIDTDVNKWLKAIEKDKIKFTQLIDSKGFDADTALQFGVDEIPSKYLFNQEGILIAKNPTEEEIIKLIEK
ncbi:TlpA family protein disulfide reductase [Flavobacterium sp. F372]|uniref:TlpA family protein disulfide reductase n=1 Tax=Flavobacterium bernardetii TaxID=2813823 RepID=A0ABR7IX49_9FLAO|nr:TlpA disulfide reductase family protein [Flavobacterium bernardetii]MBC5834359.1 TlpA family protein disulfide reductase [Flavobacterium bernardetii]NHF70002.1 TlpA family protein disulfide reductase [Flavobacterium bernardetii]